MNKKLFKLNPINYLLKVLYFGGVFFIVQSCNSVNNQPKSQVEISNHAIDSLIQASKQFYYNKSHSSPIFDSILKQAYDIAKTENNQIKLGRVLVELGKRQRNSSEFAKAVNYFQQAISISEQIPDNELHAIAAHELAVVFRRMGDNAQAHKLYIEALEWAETANDTFLIHCSLNGIGNVYFQYANYLKAIEYFHQSLNYLGKTKRNYLGEAINTNTLGEAWLFLGNSDSALFYLKRSFDIKVQIGSNIGQAICYNGIGMVYHANGNYPKAIEQFKAALAFEQEKLDLVYVSMCKTSLGKTYIATKNYDAAETILKESFEIASSIGSRNHTLEALKELAQLYNITNQTDKALIYLQTIMAYKDSINNELIQHNSEAINTLYKAERQEREILILKQDAELDALKLSRQRNLFLTIFIFTFIGIAFALGYYRQRQLQSLINQVELEQQLFRAQLNPHFIFNSLAALQNFIMQNDKIAASNYLANFSRLMRNILMGSRTNSISLIEEQELLEDYLKLQQLRFNNNFDFKLTISDNIDSQMCVLPPMLIQPFIENAIEHGMQNINYKGLIKISFEKKNEMLFIMIDDNGLGLNKKEGIPQADKNHIALATKITHERIANFKLLSKRECSLSVINKADEGLESGVQVTILIPYQEQ